MRWRRLGGSLALAGVVKKAFFARGMSWVRVGMGASRRGGEE
jgi:hypothetical protein